MKRLMLAVFSCLLVSFSTSALAEKYHYDLGKLPGDQKRLYQEVEFSLDDWTGGFEKLERVKLMIDDFIKVNPYFLPIYIEKARYTIVTGYTSGNDPRQYNLDALDVLMDIQKKDPDYPKSYVLAGHVYTNLGDLDSSQRSLEKAERLGTQNPWLHNNWAVNLIAQRNYKDALERSAKALELSGDNPKALIAAISNIETSAAKLHIDISDIDIAGIVFKSFKDPMKRLRIAERLVNAWQGRGDVLGYAYEIISRQKQETPELTQCDVEMAHLILKDGYLKTTNYIKRYDPESMEQAEEILTPLHGVAADKDRIFNMLTDIALSRRDYESAELLINDASDKGVSDKQIKLKRAMLHYATDNYQEVIRIYEELAKSDPSLRGNIILLSSYEITGKADKLDEHYYNSVSGNPHSAWANGNYASFLLFRRNKISEAIKYGEKALELMPYQMARNVTGLAYQIQAAKRFSDGKIDESLSLYERSLEIGVSDDYIEDRCMDYCPGIAQVKRHYEATYNSI